MLSIEELISYKDKIQEEAKKYGFCNVCITTKKDLEEDPFKFMVDFKGDYPPKESYSSFKNFLQGLLGNEYITLCYRIDLTKWLVNPGFPSIQYTLDTAIPLEELTHEPFPAQFARQLAKSQSVHKEVEEQNYKLKEKTEAVVDSRKRKLEGAVEDSRNTGLKKPADESSPEKLSEIKEKKRWADPKVKRPKLGKDWRNSADNREEQKPVGRGF